jgi:hypothetical protein
MYDDVVVEWFKVSGHWSLCLCCKCNVRSWLVQGLSMPWGHQVMDSRSKPPHVEVVGGSMNLRSIPSHLHLALALATLLLSFSLFAPTEPWQDCSNRHRLDAWLPNPSESRETRESDLGQPTSLWKCFQASRTNHSRRATKS